MGWHRSLAADMSLYMMQSSAPTKALWALFVPILSLQTHAGFLNHNGTMNDSAKYVKRQKYSRNGKQPLKNCAVIIPLVATKSYNCSKGFFSRLRDYKMNIDILRQYAMSFVGIPYKYGGKTPMSGFDCSGLVSEVLKAARILAPHDELNAQQIFDKISTEGSWNVLKAGSLAFYGTDNKHIDHVVFLVDTDTAIGASGGDSTTILVEDAKSRQAFVKMRNVNYRKDLIAVIRPRFFWEI